MGICKRSVCLYWKIFLLVGICQESWRESLCFNPKSFTDEKYIF
jgi:hypothetical protein